MCPKWWLQELKDGRYYKLLMTRSLEFLFSEETIKAQKSAEADVTINVIFIEGRKS